MRKTRKQTHDSLRDERKRRASSGAPVAVSADPSVPTPDLARRLVEASPLRHRVAAESIAMDAERIDRALAGLEIKRASGPLTEDEYKALAALTSGKRRLFETLGVVEVKEEEDDL